MSENETPRSDSAEGGILALAPGIARIAVTAAWRSAEWTVGAYAHVGGRVFKAAVSGENPADFLRESGTELRDYMRNVFGFADNGTPAPSDSERSSTLRDRGEELLRRSADVDYHEDAHPAYARILSELAPDEGRILRLISQQGPQPAVDVRGGLIPLESTSRVVAPGLTMIGSEAGVRLTERVPAYLNNLSRLGLIWFSRESLEDLLAYQVVEAQPDVVEAMKKAGRGARTMRRSIILTPFGDDFCETCLPLNTAELDALPVDPGPAPMATPPEAPAATPAKPSPATGR